MTPSFFPFFQAITIPILVVTPCFCFEISNPFFQLCFPSANFSSAPGYSSNTQFIKHPIFQPPNLVRSVKNSSSRVKLVKSIVLLFLPQSALRMLNSDATQEEKHSLFYIFIYSSALPYPPRIHLNRYLHGLNSDAQIHPQFDHVFATC